MSNYRKLIAALIGALGTSLASGGDGRVIAASLLAVFAVWLAPPNEAR